jgi:hypothetical protein
MPAPIRSLHNNGRSRLARRRADARREQSLRDERRKALNHPDAADVTPAAISVRDFRLKTGLSIATVNRRIKDGTLRSIKLHGRRLIAFSEIARIQNGE